MHMPALNGVRRLAAILLFTLPAAVSAQARHMELADLGRIVRVTDAQVAPDGHAVVILVARPDYDENRYRSDLVMVNVATRAEQVLLRDLRGMASPRWSPNGDRIAFLASTADSGSTTEMHAQLWTMSASGGEPSRVTSVHGGVQHFAWRSDGGGFAYVAADRPADRTGQERFNDGFEVGNNDYLITSAPTPSHLWVMAADGSGARRLTSGDWSLPTVRPPGSPPSPLTWSPDGRSIAFTRVPTPRSGDFGEGRVQVIDVESGAVRALTGGGTREGFASFSPDGKQLTYWAPRSGSTRNGNEVYVAPAGGGAGVPVTMSLDRNIARALWLPDGKSLLVGANDARQVALWVQPLGGGAARRVATGGVSPASSFWVDMSVGSRGDIAFTGSEASRPSELYYMASATAPVQRLTDYNRDVAALALGRTETIEWQGPDGFRENGVVTYPPDFTAGHKYPLVLEVHGGPRAASMETFAARPQLMAAKGWIVFQPNYRGSDNLGDRYQAAIWNDAGEGPGRDVMAGVAALIQRGVVDTTRIAVTGWSYGGYMSTWLAGRYPGVWRAAVIGAPVTNWLDQYNLGDSNIRRAEGLGGSPYTDTARMRSALAQSPMIVAPSIRAPTLILHDLRDDRVPVTQGYSLFHALKDNGVETRFIVYPIAGHSPADPVRQRDVTRRWIDWIDTHFGSGAARTSAP